MLSVVGLAECGRAHVRVQPLQLWKLQFQSYVTVYAILLIIDCPVALVIIRKGLTLRDDMGQLS